METICPLMGEGLLLLLLPSLTSAYCSPEGVVMNCSELLLDVVTALTAAALALEIVVGVEMRKMVDNDVMAATCCGEWRRTDLRVLLRVSGSISRELLVSDVGEKRPGDGDDDGRLDGEIVVLAIPFTCHDHEEQLRGAWKSRDIDDSSKQDVLVLRGIILILIFNSDVLDRA